MSYKDEVMYEPEPEREFYRIEYLNGFEVWEHLVGVLAYPSTKVLRSYRLFDDAVKTADVLAERGWRVRVVKRTETFDD